MELDLTLDQGALACCPRCNQKLLHGHDNRLDYVIALSISAILILVISFFLPFLAFDISGESRSIGLLEVPRETSLNGSLFVGLAVFLFVVMLPLTYLALLLFIALAFKYGGTYRAPMWVFRSVVHLLPWTMAEVFLIGVLVALIKIIAMADVILGLAFWAYVLFTVLFIYLVTIVDNHSLWLWSAEFEGSE